MRQLNQSHNCRGFSWVPHESTKRPRAPRQMMHMPRAVPVHTDGHDWPSPWEAKGGFCSFGAGAGSSKSGLQGDMNLRITTNPVLREREKKVAVISFSAFVLIFLHRACTHILQLMLKSNETPLVQTLDLRYYPDCFPFSPPYCMPNPWIS